MAIGEENITAGGGEPMAAAGEKPMAVDKAEASCGELATS
jgi:hypothetical protein